MFKWHTQREYGAPNIIDGWIVKFFPYDKYGKRFDLKTLTIDSNLPEELAEADVRFVEIYEDGSSTESTIELYGGFIGLEQNPENFALTPKIGWGVRIKNDEEAGYLDRMKEQIRDEGKIALVVKEIPEVLNKMDAIPMLDLCFMDGVHFPEWMEHKSIKGLRVSGGITSEERDKLLRWYPSIWLVVNGIRYEWVDGILNIHAGADIGSSLDGIDVIGTLYIANKEMKNFSYTGKTLDVKISESVTKNIGRINLRQKPWRASSKPKATKSSPSAKKPTSM
jgi:hypothetical protein